MLKSFMEITTVSIVIPVYCENDTVREIVQSISKVEMGLHKEIIIIDDGSTDGTRETLNEMQRENQTLKIFFHEKNLGKGAALRTGFANATGQIIIIQDADLEYNPQDYLKLIAPILEGKADVVYGSRFLGGPRTAMLFWHALGNRVLTLVTNVLYDAILSDMETGYKCFRTEIIREIPLHAKRFELEPEITAKILKRGIRIYEVPIAYYGREYDEGKKITGWDAIPAMWALIKYRFVD